MVTKLMNEREMDKQVAAALRRERTVTFSWTARAFGGIIGLAGIIGSLHGVLWR